MNYTYAKAPRELVLPVLKRKVGDLVAISITSYSIAETTFRS
jgi:hypothetical protein